MRTLILALTMGGFLAGAAEAREWRFEDKLLLTGGVSTVEGSGGGGLATWATTTGYGGADGAGGNFHYTQVQLPDYQLRTWGASGSVMDRVEVSFARQNFDTGATGAKLGIGQGFTFHQDVAGIKVRLLGDSVYDQDSWLPQIAVGAQYKHNDRGGLVRALGAREDSGADYYVAATKLFLDKGLLLNGTVRFTSANQEGLLGFGGPAGNGRKAEFEGSAALLLSKRLAVGAEYRSKPDNLAFAREDDWADVFAAYALNKHLSATAAYVDLGDIATFKNQRGIYFSLQAGF